MLSEIRVSLFPTGFKTDSVDIWSPRCLVRVRALLNGANWDIFASFQEPCSDPENLVTVVVQMDKMGFGINESMKYPITTSFHIPPPRIDEDGGMDGCEVVLGVQFGSSNKEVLLAQRAPFFVTWGQIVGSLSIKHGPAVLQVRMGEYERVNTRVSRSMRTLKERVSRVRAERGTAIITSLSEYPVLAQCAESRWMSKSCSYTGTFLESLLCAVIAVRGCTLQMYTEENFAVQRATSDIARMCACVCRGTEMDQEVAYHLLMAIICEPWESHALRVCAQTILLLGLPVVAHYSPHLSEVYLLPLDTYCSILGDSRIDMQAAMRIFFERYDIVKLSSWIEPKALRLPESPVILCDLPPQTSMFPLFCENVAHKPCFQSAKTVTMLSHLSVIPGSSAGVALHNMQTQVTFEQAQNRPWNSVSNMSLDSLKDENWLFLNYTSGEKMLPSIVNTTSRYFPKKFSVLLYRADSCSQSAVYAANLNSILDDAHCIALPEIPFLDGFIIPITIV